MFVPSHRAHVQSIVSASASTASTEGSRTVHSLRTPHAFTASATAQFTSGGFRR